MLHTYEEVYLTAISKRVMGCMPIMSQNGIDDNNFKVKAIIITGQSLEPETDLKIKE